MKTDLHNNRGQGLIGIIIVLVMVGLLGGGFYVYLSKQIPQSNKPAEETKNTETISPTSSEVKINCNDECSPAQSKKCVGKGFQVCSYYGNNQCLTWGPTADCPVNTACQNGSCIQLTTPAPIEPVKPTVQKCTDGTLYGQCSANKPKYCGNGNLIDKASLCSCPSSYEVYNDQCVTNVTKSEYKKIGIVYVSESNETYNANWRTDLYSNKSKIENALNNIFSKKGEKFTVDFLGEYRANNLCWSPSKIAFIVKSTSSGNCGKGGGCGDIEWYIKMPASELVNGAGNYTCFPKDRVVLWSDCDSTRCEEFNHPDFPDSRCFRLKCDQKHFTLSLQNLSWIDPFAKELQSSISFSDYDYKVIVLGKAGPIIPEIGEKEKYYYDTVMTSGDIMGYYSPSSKIIVMAENRLKIPSYYQNSEDASWTKFFMPGWQQIVHEILHQFRAVDVYKPGYFQQNLNRDEALKLEPESEVDKSIMANGWPGYCSDYQSTSCTAQDTEKIYLDKFNRIKLGLE